MLSIKGVYTSMVINSRKCITTGILRAKETILGLLLISALMLLPAFGEPTPINDSGNVSVVLYAGEYNITKDEDGFDIIQMEGFTEANSPGDPILPHRVYNVLVPPEANGSDLSMNIVSADIQVLNGTYEIRPGWPLIPAQDEYVGENLTAESWGEGKNIVNGKNLNVYEKDANYPENFVELLPYSEMRKWKFARIDFTPLQYNPITKKLTLIKSASVDISYEIPPIGLERSLAADTVMDDIAPQMFFNYDEGKAWYEVEAIAAFPQATFDYVIITTNAIVSNSTKLNDFIAHKQGLGYSVKVVTESDFSGLTGQAPNHRAEKIRKWLKDNYASTGIKYVLLIGDPHPYENGEGDVPMKMCWPRRTESTYKEAPTDYFYADLTGNWDIDGDQYYGEWSDFTASGGVDLTHEVYVGRIPVYDANYTALDSILQKIISYETSGDTSWRKNILMPMGFQYPIGGPSNGPYDGAVLGEQMRIDYLDDNSLDYWRMYQQGSGACGLNSIYTSEQELRGGTVVRDRWSVDDYGIVCWWGHGNPTQAVVGYGSYSYQPSPCNDGLLFDSPSSSSLDDSHPSFTYQCSCLNSYPEDSNNLAYAILKNGGISTLSATRVSWFNTQPYGSFDGSQTNSGIGYEYVKRLVQDLPGGDALYQTKESMSPSVNSLLMNWYDFNLYGDPSVSLKNPALQGPVVHYPFDGNADDASGNGNHGTVYGAALTEDRFGNPNSAYQFDGVDDYIFAPVNINPDVMPKMTMTAWVRADEASPVRQAISSDNGGFDRGMGVDCRFGSCCWLAFIGSGGVLGDRLYVPGEWVFLAVVYDQDAGTAKLYVNGQVYEGTGVLGPGHDYFRIGSNPSYGEYFSGVIDDVRIYDRALSDAEIRNLLGVFEVAHYPFDGNADDISGNENHGTVYGAVLTEDRFGNPNSAYQFDGIDDYIQAPVNINPDVMPKMTMTAWVRADEASPVRQAISSDNGGFDRGIGVDCRSGSCRWLAFIGSGGVLGDRLYVPGEWVFLAVVYNQDAGTAKLYVNDQVYEGSGVLGPGHDYFRIGSNPSYGEYFSGVIDEVRIYNRALSDEEVQMLYSS